MFGWVIVTGKKILAAIFIAILIYFLGPSLHLSESATMLVLYALAAGMIFPDLDMITSFLKQALHAATVFLFLFALVVVALYPVSIQISGEMCSETVTHAIFGIIGIVPYCNAGTALIFMAVCYFLVRIVVGWMPDGYMFHSYVMAVLVTICTALFVRFIFDEILLVPMIAAFAIGYFLHMALDAGYHHLKN